MTKLDTSIDMKFRTSEKGTTQTISLFDKYKEGKEHDKTCSEKIDGKFEYFIMNTQQLLQISW